jgi:predicted dehydrogenase
MTLKSYRAALVGTGAFAASHVQAIRANAPRIELVAAVNLNEDKGREFCQQHHIPAFFVSTDAMLHQIQPEIVLICTPPHTHVPLSVLCLRAGAHVLCEKPLCGSLSDFDALQLAEKESGCFVSSVAQWRFGSAAQHLKHLIETGALGTLRVAVCHTLWYRDADYYSTEWRADAATALGGTTTGHGIHLMDLMLWLLPDWQRVTALVATLEQPITVDNLSMAQVQFQSGALASIVNSALSLRQETYLRLDFQRATLEMRGLYSANNDHWVFTPANDTDASLWSFPQNQPGILEAQVAAWLDRLDNHERPLVSGAEARRIIEFLTCLYKSSQLQQPILRDSIVPDDPFYASMRPRFKSSVSD